MCIWEARCSVFLGWRAVCVLSLGGVVWSVVFGSVVCVCVCVSFLGDVVCVCVLGAWCVCCSWVAPSMPSSAR